MADLAAAYSAKAKLIDERDNLQLLLGNANQRADRQQVHINNLESNLAEIEAAVEELLLTTFAASVTLKSAGCNRTAIDLEHAIARVRAAMGRKDKP